MKFITRVTHTLVRAEEWIFANPKIILGVILAVTILFATRLPGLRIYTDFADGLLKQRRVDLFYGQIALSRPAPRPSPGGGWTVRTLPGDCGELLALFGTAAAWPLGVPVYQHRVAIGREQQRAPADREAW